MFRFLPLATALLCLLMVLPASAQECVTTPPPEGAIVVFDGTSTANWNNPWPVEDGVMTVRGGSTVTKESFGDHHLHIEFRTPETGDGNSGVYLFGNYEIQVLSSHGQQLHSGACGGIYGHKPAAVNASLPAGEWQSYDILFMGPEVDEDGNVTKQATITVIHNGLYIHNAVPSNRTNGGIGGPHAETGPLMLQDHGNPVQYRNIWVLPYHAP